MSPLKILFVNFRKLKGIISKKLIIWLSYAKILTKAKVPLTFPSINPR